MTTLPRIGIEHGDGVLYAYVTGASGLRPAIVILHEIFGANIAMRQEAEALAAAGYLVCVPDLYDRVARGTELLYSEDERNHALDLWKRLDADLESTISIVARVTEYMRLHPHCDGRVALVGFCLGGKLALLAAADHVSDAAVAFYPVQMQLHRQDLERSSIPVQIQLGDADSHIPPEVVAELASIVECLPASELIVHPGAEHGFYNPVRTIGFHPTAALAARARMLDFLARALESVQR